MALTLTTDPVRTINGVLSNVSAGRSQAPFTFTTTEYAQPNIKVEIYITSATDTVNLTGVVYKYSPKSDGTLFIDLSSILSEYMERQGIKDIAYRLFYGQQWTGGPSINYSISPAYQAIYGEKQIYSIGGANVYNYLFDLTNPGKALTKFIEPKIWAGWKRTIGVIVDSRSITAKVMTVQYLNINKGYISDGITTNLSDTVDLYDLDLQSSAAAVPASAKYLRATFTKSPDTILQSVDYKVTPVCANPIFVEYLNSLGAWEQFVFDLKQDVQIEAEEGIISSKAISQDYATANVTNIRIANTWTQQLICKTDGLSNADLLALNEIKRSTAVRLLLTRDGSRFVQVVVSNSYGDIYSTDNTQNDFMVQLTMPSNFNVFDAIDYEDAGFQAHLNVAFTAAYN
jgi:hypothetical protein